MQKLVSIIVPVYNVEKYIDKCVRSLLKQDYGNIEVILVDDGSPDKSGYIIDRLKEEDNRIVVIHQEIMAFLVLEMQEWLSLQVSISPLSMEMIGLMLTM